MPISRTEFFCAVFMTNMFLTYGFHLYLSAFVCFVAMFYFAFKGYSPKSKHRGDTNE